MKTSFLCSEAAVTLLHSTKLRWEKDMMTTNCLSVWRCSKHAASMETDLCQYYLCSDLWQSMCKYVSYKYKTPSTETNTLKNICKYKTALQIYIHCIYPQAFVNPVFILELKKTTILHLQICILHSFETNVSPVWTKSTRITHIQIARDHLQGFSFIFRLI